MNDEVIEGSITSPVKTKTSPPLSFPEALKRVIEGKRITKLEWNNRNAFGTLANGVLAIHKPEEPENSFHPWTINDGDLLGTDWIVL